MEYRAWLRPKRRSGPIDAVHDLFRGQERLPAYPETARGEEPITHESLPAATGNRLRLTPRGVLENLREVQAREGVARSTALSRLDFALALSPRHERTLTYLHTIHDLAASFCFDRFVILAASAADRESIQRELDSSGDRLSVRYSGPRVSMETPRSWHRLAYHFASGGGAQLLVMAPGSLVPNRRRTLFRPHETLCYEPPISLIRFTRPIVLVDERRVGGAKSYRGATGQLSPLCVFRYFTTPAKADHWLYREAADEPYDPAIGR